MIVMDSHQRFNGYTRFVEICGNCKKLITWDESGKAVCSCGNPLLQFIKEEDAKELGII